MRASTTVRLCTRAGKLISSVAGSAAASSGKSVPRAWKASSHSGLGRRKGAKRKRSASQSMALASASSRLSPREQFSAIACAGSSSGRGQSRSESNPSCGFHTRQRPLLPWGPGTKATEKRALTAALPL